MTLERVDRLVESAEVEAGVGEAEQNRSAQSDRRAWKREALGAQQIAMSAADVAARRQHMIGLDHGCPGDGQRFLGRFRRGHGPLDLTPRSIGRAAPAVQVAQVLARQDFTAGFTRSDEAFGGDFEQRNRLACSFCSNVAWPRTSVGHGCSTSPAPRRRSRLRASSNLPCSLPDAVETQQVVVRPRSIRPDVRTSQTATRPSDRRGPLNRPTPPPNRCRPTQPPSGDTSGTTRPHASDPPQESFELKLPARSEEGDGPARRRAVIRGALLVEWARLWTAAANDPTDRPRGQIHVFQHGHRHAAPFAGPAIVTVALNCARPAAALNWHLQPNRPGRASAIR